MVPEFERAAFALEEGELSGVVETPFGFHIIEREPLVEVHLVHVLAQYAGAERSKATRSREEARARAEEAMRRLRAGEDPATVVAELSDGPSASRGGDLGWFQHGQLLPQLDEAAFALEPGEVSDVIESPVGFHVLLRVE